MAQPEGYRYEDPASTEPGRRYTEELVQSLRTGTPGFLNGYSVHKIFVGQELMGWLTLLEVNPGELGGTPGVYVVEGLLGHGVGAATPTMSEQTVAGEWMGVAEATVEGKHRVAYVWPRETVLTLAAGSSRDDIETFMTALVRAYQVKETPSGSSRRT